MRASVGALAALALGVAVALVGEGLHGNPAQVAAAGGAATSRHYFLPATPQNVQWGWYDPAEKPRLTVNSGDTVSIETLSHSLGQIRPGVDMDDIVKLRKENDGGGPHSITGPIYVTGAELATRSRYASSGSSPNPTPSTSTCRARTFRRLAFSRASFPKASSASTSSIS